MTSAPDRSELLGPLLKGVSRSFYLTIRILPVGMRAPVGLAYLLARSADTIADTSLISPQKRMQLLLSLREQVNGVPDEIALRAIREEVATQQSDSKEKALLESLSSALTLLNDLNAADRESVRTIVNTLTEGMEFDLRNFPDESAGRVVALQELAELDRYTYLVAGCVGEFWTIMTARHVVRALRDSAEKMIDRGIRFGKALQYTNVLRDCGKDLRIGRCYLPETMLSSHGLTVNDLLSPGGSQLARPVLLELIREAMEHYRHAIDYITALSPWSIRLRLACLWPVAIGLNTLVLLAGNNRWLEPGHASKIRRKDVYRIMAASLPVVASNSAVRTWLGRSVRALESAMVSNR
ncbi:phytoene/squalene synthase family protein [Acidicapsa dinghuensis]|uniref:Phytoene/squalene synthase family protein n=1 Tax=Acidicapsa dinghuensis TaxID=2218256 RepID=A0ABW1EL73_9BACT|nr:phytoene/squalene synthase family protein [Acidicapsa dinghuensis]